MDKEFRKSVRLFKKAIIRRKCLKEEGVKYLVDFGKRRSVPDIVIRHGSMAEESSSGRKKYWLNESYVPLHLLKSFEERRVARKSPKLSSGKLSEPFRVIKKSLRDRGFSYLFSKAARSEYYQCGHCSKDVLIRYYNIVLLLLIVSYYLRMISYGGISIINCMRGEIMQYADFHLVHRHFLKKCCELLCF